VLRTLQRCRDGGRWRLISCSGCNRTVGVWGISVVWGGRAYDASCPFFSGNTFLSFHGIAGVIRRGRDFSYGISGCGLRRGRFASACLAETAGAPVRVAPWLSPSEVERRIERVMYS